MDADLQRRLHNLYTSPRWVRRSRMQLAMHPLCQMCKERGIVEAASVAHHVVPHHGDKTSFFLGEIISVCKACHDGRCQQQEKRGYVCDIGPDGWPTDERHPVYR